jgi:amino acid transporter
MSAVVVGRSDNTGNRQQAEPATTPPPGAPGAKGLRGGAIGLLSSTVIGVASTAPAYSTAATIGLIVAILGVHTPGMLIAAFVPMLFVAVAFREFNKVDPDCGTTFSWVGRAFGPVAGWLGGWGMVAACVVVMSSVAQVAAQYTFLLVGADGLASNQVWLTVGGVLFIVVLTAICYLGVEISARLQSALLAIELVTIVAFAVVALIKVGTGHELTGGAAPSAGWFTPFGGSFSDLSDAFLLAIFIYWGWDTSLSLNEETKDSNATPGRAAVLATVLLVAVFALVSTAMLSFAGPSFLANHSGDAIGSVGPLVFGSWAGKLLILCVLTSTAASTQTTIMPTARATLSMGAHGALPPVFARVHPRFQTPGFSTVAMGAISAVLFIGLSAVSTNVLADSASAVGLLIAFYYGITALACPWYFRRTLRDSVRNLVLRGALPALGGLFMIAAFVQSVKSYLPAKNSYSSIGGVGGVFWLGAGSLALGVVFIAALRRPQRTFFARRASVQVDTALPTSPAI